MGLVDGAKSSLLSPRQSHVHSHLLSSCKLGATHSTKHLRGRCLSQHFLHIPPRKNPFCPPFPSYLQNGSLHLVKIVVGGHLLQHFLHVSLRESHILPHVLLQLQTVSHFSIGVLAEKCLSQHLLHAPPRKCRVNPHFSFPLANWEPPLRQDRGWKVSPPTFSAPTSVS